jgi:hypothetical protein
MLGAISRKFGRNVSNEVLGNVYKTCVRSVLDYGCVAWDPVLKKDIDELERSQFFALRLFLRNWNISYQNALSESNWPSLAERRKQLKLCQFYKYYNGLHDFSNRFFIHKSESGNRFSVRLNEPHHLILPKPNFERFKQSFLFSALSLWNSLSYDVVQCTNVSTFRDSVSKLNFC